MKDGTPFLLSEKGSTRATAYGFSNKSVTVDGRTHVVWLDAVAQVRGRTYDHAVGTWSDTFDIFAGSDNHTSPALTVDWDRHIRIVGGPHGFYRNWNQARFKWFRSQHPNQIDAWTTATDFGYNATYASMIHTSAGLDAIAYRGGEDPRSLVFQRQRPLGHWTSARELMRQEIEPQYTHNGAWIAADSQDALYVAGHFYNVGGNRDIKRSYGVGILKSADLGTTWTDLRGEPLAIPVPYSECIAIPPIGADVRLNGLALDSAGHLWSLISSTGTDDPALRLCRWTGEKWETRDLAPSLPADRVAVDSVLTIDARDRLHAAVTAVRPGADDPAVSFGLSSSEVFHLVCDADGKPRGCVQISVTDPTRPNWLPNISQPGPFCPVERPVILYTHGIAGEGCLPTTETEVYCVVTD